MGKGYKSITSIAIMGEVSDCKDKTETGIGRSFRISKGVGSQTERAPSRVRVFLLL